MSLNHSRAHSRVSMLKSIPPNPLPPFLTTAYVPHLWIYVYMCVCMYAHVYPCIDVYFSLITNILDIILPGSSNSLYITTSNIIDSSTELLHSLLKFDFFFKYECQCRTFVSKFEVSYSYFEMIPEASTLIEFHLFQIDLIVLPI